MKSNICDKLKRKPKYNNYNIAIIENVVIERWVRYYYNTVIEYSNVSRTLQNRFFFINFKSHDSRLRVGGFNDTIFYISYYGCHLYLYIKYNARNFSEH